MKHKTIKKSIIFIMIATLLLSCVSSLAATVSVEDFDINVPTEFQLTPDMVINSQPDQATGNYYITYKFDFSFDGYIHSTGKNKYWNGLYLWRLTCSLPAAYTVKAIDWQFNNIATDTLNSFGTMRQYGAAVATFFTSFTNYYTNVDYIPLVSFTFYITIQAIQTPTVPAPYLGISVSTSDIAGSVARTNYPETGKGLAGIIGASVMQAINNSDLPTALDLLYISSIAQEGLLNSVLNELNDANLYLGDLLYYMQNTQNARLNTIISKIQELIDMGRQDTQAQNELGAAAQQMENAAAAMNVTKPNIAAVIPETLLAADAAQAQSDIFAWLQNSYILQILIACFTIALIGFVLYGKSG